MKKEEMLNSMCFLRNLANGDTNPSSKIMDILRENCIFPLEIMSIPCTIAYDVFKNCWCIRMYVDNSSMYFDTSMSKNPNCSLPVFSEIFDGKEYCYRVTEKERMFVKGIWMFGWDLSSVSMKDRSYEDNLKICISIIENFLGNNNLYPDTDYRIYFNGGELKEYGRYYYKIETCGSHPCIYINLDKEDQDKCNIINLNVHGGVTYTDDYMFGWDYAHPGDYVHFEHIISRELNGHSYSLNELEKDAEDAIDELKSIKDSRIDNSDTITSFEITENKDVILKNARHEIILEIPARIAKILSKNYTKSSEGKSKLPYSVGILNPDLLNKLNKPFDFSEGRHAEVIDRKRTKAEEYKAEFLYSPKSCFINPIEKEIKDKFNIK